MGLGVNVQALRKQVRAARKNQDVARKHTNFVNFLQALYAAWEAEEYVRKRVGRILADVPRILKERAAHGETFAEIGRLQVRLDGAGLDPEKSLGWLFQREIERRILAQSTKDVTFSSFHDSLACDPDTDGGYPDYTLKTTILRAILKGV